MKSPMLAFALSLLAALGSLATLPPPALGAATFVVNRIGDAADLNPGNGICDTSTASGRQCTLRAAIQEANALAGTDTINFKITSTSKTITPTSPLPPITDRVTINGYSQKGAKTNTRANGSNAVLKIVLDGINAGNESGLVIDAHGVTIRGLVIQRFEQSGILIRDESATISGNFIGTTAAGTAARGNGTGVRLLGQGHLIGGTKPGQRNLISGNLGVGVFVDETIGGSSIQNNYIGTDKVGTAALGNGSQGILVNGPNTRIGGTTAGAGNLISGNMDDGVRISGTFSPNVSGNLVQGNRIGTDRSGSAALGNGAIGVHVKDSAGTLVGGTTAAARNVISGNAHSGVVISVGTTASKVKGNFIGTRSDGTGDLGNGHYGVAVTGSSNSEIGGTEAGAGNVISGNGFDGVASSSSTSVSIRKNVISSNDRDGIGVCSNGTHDVIGNLIVANSRDGVGLCGVSASSVRIISNSILGNGGLGINLSGPPENADKVNPNDPDDPDTGANGRQNYPVLTLARRSSGTGVTIVTGTLDSTPNTSFRIELFVAAADASGHGEGMTLVGAKTITTNANGDKGFTFASGQLPVGMVLTSTATQQSPGATSEFSANIAVIPGP